MYLECGAPVLLTRPRKHGPLACPTHRRQLAAGLQLLVAPQLLRMYMCLPVQAVKRSVCMTLHACYCSSTSWSDAFFSANPDHEQPGPSTHAACCKLPVQLAGHMVVHA